MGDAKLFKVPMFKFQGILYCPVMRKEREASFA